MLWLPKSIKRSHKREKKWFIYKVEMHEINMSHFLLTQIKIYNNSGGGRGSGAGVSAM